MKDATKTCHACGYLQTLPQDIWQKIETANEKHRPARHKGCGGTFVSPVARLERRSA